MYYPEWQFNEWQAVSLYFTDLLLIALFIFWASRSFRKSRSSQLKTNEYFLFFFLVVSAISIKNSSALYLGVYQLSKLIEFVLFYFYLKNYALQKFNWSSSSVALIVGGVFQAMVGIIQFLKQSSLGLHYFGESLIRLDIRGTAYFLNSAGEKIIRAYGTTPHPNILAGYLLLVLFIYYALFLYQRSDRKIYSLQFAVYTVIVFSFFLTFSRVVIFTWAAAFIIGAIAYYKSYPREVRNIFIITACIVVVFASLYWPEILNRLTIASDDEGLLLRKYYVEEVIRSDLAIFGIGIGNFVNWLIEKNPWEAHWFYQPVHNMYLLIYSETGILGILSFTFFLMGLFKKYFIISNPLFIILASCFLFIGFFDHFLWTLQQGKLAFWTALSLLTYYINGDTIKK